MNAGHYLRTKLETLHNIFPHLSIKYGFDKDIEAHLVELLPIEEYKNNRALDKAWIAITKEFRAIFPDQDISFFTGDSLLNIDNALVEWLPLYKNEKEVLSSIFCHVTGYNDIPTGDVKDRSRQSVTPIVNPVMTPIQDLYVEPLNEFSYPLAA